MSGSHLDRTGFRHLVMGIATIASLTGVMWASSSFQGGIDNKTLARTLAIENTYHRISGYTIPIIVLNSCVAFIVVVMSLVVDWHFDVSLPAYIEYAWVGVAWCIQLVSIIIIATVASPFALCHANDLAPSDTWSRDAICSNWKAVLAPSIITLMALAFHLSWHMLFRLCHRDTLANQPIPVNIWTTPLPKKYPMDFHGKAKRQAKVSKAHSKAPISPADSCASTPVTAHHAPYRTEGSARGYAASAAAARVPADDLEKAIGLDNMSIASSKIGEIVPPGLRAVAESRIPHATDH